MTAKEELAELTKEVKALREEVRLLRQAGPQPVYVPCPPPPSWPYWTWPYGTWAWPATFSLNSPCSGTYCTTGAAMPTSTVSYDLGNLSASTGTADAMTTTASLSDWQQASTVCNT